MSWWPSDSPYSTKAPRSEAAAKLLTLEGWPDVTPEQVKAAYKAAVKASATAEGPGAGVNKLQDAKAFLLELLPMLDKVDAAVNDKTEKVCKMCNGSGRVGLGFGRPCSACQGTGQAS